MSDTLQTLLYIFGAIGALFVGYWIAKGIHTAFFKPYSRLAKCEKEIEQQNNYLEILHRRTSDATDRLDSALANFNNQAFKSTQTKGPKHVSR